MAYNVYGKGPFSLSVQLSKLESQGVLFDDRKKTENFPYFVSYYRLRAYTYLFQDSTEDGERIFFCEDIRFDDIKDIYVFDCDMRSLVFNAIACIEVSVRARMTQIYSESTGGWHRVLDEDLYRCDYDVLMGNIADDVKWSNEDFIKHYKDKYGVSDFLPNWMSLELVSFETLGRLYQFMKKDDGKRLLESYGIADVNVFENWLHAISNLRNCCAHHGRI